MSNLNSEKYRPIKKLSGLNSVFGTNHEKSVFHVETISLSFINEKNKMLSEVAVPPGALHDPAPHVMVFTPQTSVFTILRQSGTENVLEGGGPGNGYRVR